MGVYSQLPDLKGNSNGECLLIEPTMLDDNEGSLEP